MVSNDLTDYEKVTTVETTVPNQDALKAFVQKAASIKSGELSKASFVSETGTILTFQYNPEKIEVERYGEIGQHPGSTANASPEWQTGKIKLSISDVYFDTYDTKEDVRTKYINAFEDLACAKTMKDSELRPVKIIFIWGTFQPAALTGAIKVNTWYLKSIKISYIMFLPDGTPIRAQVHFELISADTFKEQLEAAKTKVPANTNKGK